MELHFISNAETRARFCWNDRLMDCDGVEIHPWTVLDVARHAIPHHDGSKLDHPPRQSPSLLRPLTSSYNTQLTCGAMTRV